MPLQLTNKITHGYSVGDMLNNIEGIIDLLKHVIFFWRAWFVCKFIGKFLMTNLSINWKLPNRVFPTEGFYS
jgi:hypothetical protein